MVKTATSQSTREDEGFVQYTWRANHAVRVRGPASFVCMMTQKMRHKTKELVLNRRLVFVVGSKFQIPAYAMIWRSFQHRRDNVDSLLSATIYLDFDLFSWEYKQKKRYRREDLSQCNVLVKYKRYWPESIVVIVLTCMDDSRGPRGSLGS